MISVLIFRSPWRCCRLRPLECLSEGNSEFRGILLATLALVLTEVSKTDDLFLRFNKLNVNGDAHVGGLAPISRLNPCGWSMVESHKYHLSKDKKRENSLLIDLIDIYHSLII